MQVELSQETATQITEYVVKSSACINQLEANESKHLAKIAELEQQLLAASTVKQASFQKTAATLAGPADALVTSGLLSIDEKSNWITKAASDDAFVLEFVTKLASSMSESPEIGYAAAFNHTKEAEAPSCPFEQLLFPGYSN